MKSPTISTFATFELFRINFGIFISYVSLEALPGYNFTMKGHDQLFYAAVIIDSFLYYM